MEDDRIQSTRHKLANGYKPKEKRKSEFFRKKMKDVKKENLREDLKIEGTMWKRGEFNSAWKLRDFFLTTTGELFYFKPNSEIPQGGLLIKGFDLNNVESKSKKPHSFMLKPKKSQARTWYFSCKSEAEKNEWMGAFHEFLANEKQYDFDAAFGDYKIAPNDLKYEENELGSGGVGIVRGATWKNVSVAVKEIRGIPDGIDPETLDEFFSEIKILSKLRHPSIVTMYGYSVKDGIVCLVTEYVEGGDLSGALQDPSKKLTLILQCQIASSVAQGMEYLHKKNVTHRDLKPQNILIDNWPLGKMKVCDFGLSTMKRKRKQLQDSVELTDTRDTGPIGTPAYAAPELSNPNHSQKVDVFSFGCILWELNTRKELWPGLYPHQIDEKVKSGERMEIPEGCLFDELINKCWNEDPSKRPSFEELTEEIEKIKNNIVLPLEKKKRTKEYQVAELFQKKSSIKWSDFCKKVATIFDTKPNVVEKLKYCLAENNEVSQEKWENLMEWFSPVIIRDDYHHQNNNNKKKKEEFLFNNDAEGAYYFEEMADIVSTSFFHGFMGKEESKDILMDQEEGTYLFRFSSEPKCYSLSVSIGSSVAHWRMTCEKITRGPTYFHLMGKKYRSFNDIVRDLEKSGLVSAVQDDLSVFLKKPYDRK